MKYLTAAERETEKRLVCAALSYPRELPVIELDPRALYVPLHRATWEAMLQVVDSGEPFNPSTVAAAAGGAHAEGVHGIAEYGMSGDLYLTRRDLHSYARQVQDAHRKRSLLIAVAKVMSSAADHDAAGLLDALSETCDAAAGDVPIGGLSQAELVEQEMRRLYEPQEADKDVPTGFGALDDLIGGLPRSNVTVVGAATSNGKSSLCLAIASNVAQRGQRVAFISLEDTALNTVGRSIVRAADVDARSYLRGNLSNKERGQINAAANVLRQLDVQFFEPSLIGGVQRFYGLLRRILKGYKPDLVVIDYLQQLVAGSRDRVGELTDVSLHIQQLTKQSNAAVLVASQLNRAKERNEETPTLSSLRGSGAIEQHSHTTVLIHRPEALQERSLSQVIVAKQKNGPTGHTFLRFDVSRSTFRDASAEELRAGRELCK